MVELPNPDSNTDGEIDADVSDELTLTIVNGSSYTLTVGLVSLHDQGAVVVITETIIPSVVESGASNVVVAAAVSLPLVLLDGEGVIVLVVMAG